jgi:hypothetical protein
MKDKINKTNIKRLKKKVPGGNDLQGYPQYPSSEDIYGKYHKDRKIDPEDPSSTIIPFYNINTGKFKEMDFLEDLTGEDLDIPGSELDDDLEFIGSEDEENNYYSLGGDNHNDLEED